MDDFDLAARSPITCGWCASLLPKTVMHKTQVGVFGAFGALGLGKDVERAWLLLTPPKPPFVAVVADATLQHLVWKTPVTRSSDLLIIRLGHRILTINRPLLLDLRSVLTAIRREHDIAPFLRLDREVKDLSHGALNPLLAEVVSHETRQQLYAAGPGELWALATLVKKKPPTPVRPEPITL